MRRRRSAVQPSRLCIVLALGLLALGAPVSAIPYLQAGVDAARTGVTADPGPATSDVAFLESVPGRLAGTPLIFDGGIFVATFASPWTDDEATDVDASGIWRIDTTTTERRLLVDPSPMSVRLSGLASDGRLLFTNAGNAFQAYDAVSGELVWDHDHELLTPLPPQETICRDAAVHNGTVYVSCYQRGAQDSVLQGSPFDEAPTNQVRQYAMALSIETGELLWRWVQDIDDEYDFAVALDGSSEVSGWVGRIAVIDDQPYVVTMNPARALPGESPTTTSNSGTLWALDDEGAERWSWGDSLKPGAPMYTFPYYDLQFTGDSQQLFVGGFSVILVDPDTGDWTLGPNLQDATGEAGVTTLAGLPLALQHEALYIGTLERMHRYDHLTSEVDWSSNVSRGPVAPNVDERSTLLASRGLVFIDANPGTSFHSGSVLTALAKSGEVLWQVQIPDTSPEARDTRGILAQPERHLATADYAVGDGILAYVTSDGRVHVFGRTPASIAVDVQTAERYPAAGESVQVDLSGTQPGADGPATRFRVLWGDGVEASWQDSPVFEHTYAGEGTFVATAMAENAAGQTASQTFIYEVGGSPPPQPGLLQTLVAPENRALAWSLLGGFVLVVAFAVAVTRHRHARLQSLPLAAQERTAAYQAALARAVEADGTLPPAFTPMLSALRSKLGLTERDHAILLASVQANRRPTGLILMPGTSVLGKYRIVKPLGTGGQGSAYLAEDTLLGREVVVKVLGPGHGDQAVLLREARTLAALRHPNVVTVFDVDRVGDSVFMAMERLTGSLKDRLAKGPVDRTEFALLAGGLLAALEAVHEAGMTHLDVKPANVLLTSDGNVKLADFGVAHRPSPDATVDSSRPSASGTVAYMAPEQARGQGVTRRSDLFAAGLVLYEAWTGRSYFSPRPGESPIEVQARVAAAAPFNGNLRAPAALKAWFARALHPEPEQRFDTAAHMLDALPTEELVRERRLA